MHRLAWTSVQRRTGYRGIPRRTPGRRNRRTPAQPPPGGDLPQGARRRHRNPAREVVRRPNGARGGGPRQGGPGHRLHLLLVEEPPDRRGLPRPGAAGPLLHRRERHHARAGGQGVAPSCPGGRGRTRGRRGVHDGAAVGGRRSGGAVRARPHRHRNPSAHHLGDRTLRRCAHSVRARDDFLRRAGERRQRRLHLSPNRRPSRLCRRPHPAAAWRTARRRQMTVKTEKPVLDPYDYDFHEDPYPYYKRLRDEAPLYRNEELNFWALSRHQDVWQGFRNSTSLSNRDGVSLDPVSRGPHASKTMSFLAMDDPAHLRLRTLVSKGFTPRRIRELEPRVTELAVQHLDTMLDKATSGTSETVDYVAEFAGKLPMDVISELMGVPLEDRDRIRGLADGVMHREDGVNDVPASAIEASINLIVYYQEMIAERRKKAADDLTTALLEAEIDGDRLTDDEVLGFLFL